MPDDADRGESVMRVSGFLTGSCSLGALALNDMGAPRVYCYLLLAIATISLIILWVTVARPGWLLAWGRRMAERFHHHGTRHMTPA